MNKQKNEEGSGLKVPLVFITISIVVLAIIKFLIT